MVSTHGGRVVVVGGFKRRAILCSTLPSSPLSLQSHDPIKQTDLFIKWLITGAWASATTCIYYTQHFNTSHVGTFFFFFLLWHQILCYPSFFRWIFFRLCDVGRQLGWGDCTGRAALWLTADCCSAELTSCVLGSHWEHGRWIERRYGDLTVLSLGSVFT